MGVLIVSDTVGLGCSRGALRDLMADISVVLEENGHRELADWLTGDLSRVELYSHLDVRWLTPRNQDAFRAAAGTAYERVRQTTPAGRVNPVAWESYLALFENLVRQIEWEAQGKVPDQWPNLTSIGAHDGERDGPGWGRPA
ncbi:hypothetical protein QFZ27_005534 [Inquilinus ginsengisoli]